MIVREAADRDWYTVPEAAEQLGLSANAVYTLLTARKLGCRKVGPRGGRYQVTREHLRAYLASCEVAPAGAPPSPSRAFGRAGRVERLDGKPLRYFED